MTIDELSIRWVIRRDLPYVMRIENRSYEVPWTEDDFIQHMRAKNCIGMVCEVRETIVGFMVYQFHESSIKLLNIAVDPMFRRDGIGTAMIAKLRTKLAGRRKWLTTEVRETNLPAHLFLKSCGLRAVWVVRQPFDDSDEDAYLFRVGRANESRVKV